MFNNLIESDSHREEFARRSSFFFGTLVLYALLFLVGGVVSIYAYNAQLENQNLEVLTLLPPVEMLPVTQTHEDVRPAAPHRNTDNNAMDQRRAAVATVEMPRFAPRDVSDRAGDIKPIRPGVPVAITGRDIDADIGNNNVGPSRPDGSNFRVAASHPLNIEIDTPPPARPAPSPGVKKENRPVSMVLTGKIISKPNPPYPALGKQTHTEGVVTVQIIVDEAGKVISAQAVSGPPLLRQSAVQAAYQTRFSPTLLSNVPVKVTGTITFNFVLQ